MRSFITTAFALLSGTVSARLAIRDTSLTVAPSSGNYVSVGCYTEGAQGRALQSNSKVDWSSMSPDVCAAFCSQGGYTLFGIEYSAECYCGNMLQIGSTVADPTSCNMPCPGNNTLNCGAGWRLQVYSVGGKTPYIVQSPVIVPSVGAYKFSSCYTEGVQGRALASLSTSAVDMTVESCQAFCAGHLYFGVEYGAECYCGDVISHSAVPVANTDCNMLCAGNQTEYCGAGNRVQVYQMPTVTTSSTALLASVTPTAVPVPAHVYLGCYTEGSASRALMGATLVDYAAMTVEKCAAFCLPTFPIFGVEYGGECYCGSTLQLGSIPTLSSDCWMGCNGNSTETCGAGNRLSLYASQSFPLASLTSSAALATGTAAVPVSVQSVGNYQYQGCYSDTDGPRALASKTWVDYGAMTVEACAASCSGYAYFGLEYSNECYCGNSLLSSSVQASGCNMLCNANPLEYCGGSWRLSLYSNKAYSASVSQASVSSASVISASVASISQASVASVSQASVSQASVYAASQASVASVSQASVSQASAASAAARASISQASVSQASVASASQASVYAASQASVASVSQASVSQASAYAASQASVASVSQASVSQASAYAASQASVASASQASVYAASQASVASVSQASVSQASAYAASQASAASVSQASVSQASAYAASQASVASVSQASVSQASVSQASAASAAARASISQASVSQASVASVSQASVASVSQASASQASVASVSQASVSQASAYAASQASVASVSQASVSQASVASVSQASVSQASVASASQASASVASVASASSASVASASRASASAAATTPAQLVSNRFFNSTSGNAYMWSSAGSATVYSVGQGQTWSVPDGNYASMSASSGTSSWSQVLTLPSSNSKAYTVNYLYRQTLGNINTATCVWQVTLGGQTVQSQTITSSNRTTQYTMQAAPTQIITLSGSTTATLLYSLTCTGSGNLSWDFSSVSVTVVGS